SLSFPETAPPAVYTLSLPAALPISAGGVQPQRFARRGRRDRADEAGQARDGRFSGDDRRIAVRGVGEQAHARDRCLVGNRDERVDRKSTRLNSKSRENLVCRLLLEK